MAFTFLCTKMVEKINLLQKYVSLQYPSSTVSTIAQKGMLQNSLSIFLRPTLRIGQEK